MVAIKEAIKKIGNVFASLKDCLLIKALKLAERIKFQDKRRKKIYNSFSLTDSQQRATNHYYKTHYGKKVSLKWHKYYASYTRHFDKTFFPELLYIPELEHYLNVDENYVKTFADKNVIPFLAAFVGIKTPRVVCSCTSGVYRNGDYRIVPKEQIIRLIDNKGKFFFKPSVDSDSGRGCCIVEFVNGIDGKSGKTIEDILDQVQNGWVIQDIVKTSTALSNLSPTSVNTFRIMTYIWKGKIYSVPSILRIGRAGAFVDNAHAGGIFIGIDDDGSLHEEAFTEFQERFFEHPDTHISFKGYSIKQFPLVLDAAKRLHELIPQVGIINWDFTLDENDEPLLIEANTLKGGIWIFQMAHGKGPFGDNTEEILEWLRKARKKSYLKRKVLASQIKGKN